MTAELLADAVVAAAAAAAGWAPNVSATAAGGVGARWWDNASAAPRWAFGGMWPLVPTPIMPYGPNAMGALRQSVQGWLLSNETGKANAWRRFQVRDTGSFGPPAVTNLDRELHHIWFEVVVAYPQTHRAGQDGALDRDDVMRQDQIQIETAIGVRGSSNFRSPYPVASWVEAEETQREVGDGVDFLVIRQRMMFYETV
jgi:hypothetical protein